MADWVRRIEGFGCGGHQGSRIYVKKASGFEDLGLERAGFTGLDFVFQWISEPNTFQKILKGSQEISNLHICHDKLEASI